MQVQCKPSMTFWVGYVYRIYLIFIPGVCNQKNYRYQCVSIPGYGIWPKNVIDSPLCIYVSYPRLVRKFFDHPLMLKVPDSSKSKRQ